MSAATAAGGGTGPAALSVPRDSRTGPARRVGKPPCTHLHRVAVGLLAGLALVAGAGAAHAQSPPTISSLTLSDAGTPELVFAGYVVAENDSLPLEVDAITGDDVVNITEKAEGFSITGNTGTESGASVSVTIGSESPLTATSGADGQWSVSVPAAASYITGTSVTVTVSASKAGLDPPEDVTRTLGIDLDVPTLVTSATSADGAKVLLTFSEALSATTAPTTAFTVTVASSARGVSSVFASGLWAARPSVTLVLASPVASSEAVTVAYADPSASDDDGAVQDAAGNDAETFSATAVTNNVQPGTEGEVLWSVNMTAGLVSFFPDDETFVAGYTGWDGGGSGTIPASAEFLYRGTNYTVTHVLFNESVVFGVANPTEVFLGLSPLFPAAPDDPLILALDGAEFRLDEAARETNGHDWADPALTWSDGEPVAVKLIAVPPPSVAAIAVINAPSSRVYAIGDTIDLTVQFTKDVTLDKTGGTPELELTVGNSTRTATCATTSGMHLACRFRVDEGIAGRLGVAANKLTLEGGTLTGPDGRSADTTYTADEVAIPVTPAYRVDGVRPTLNIGDDARQTSADGTKVFLTFSEPLSSTTVPASAFAVTVDGTPRNVTLGGTGGPRVVLTLAPPVTAGQEVTVAYTDPSEDDDENAVQDLAGNDAATFPAQMVTNKVAESSTDATLSALNLSDVTLAPTFHTDSLNYTASVANSVSSTTVTPTTSHGSATVAYFDGSDRALADADGITAGHQVALNVGANTIKVKVTAEDETTTKTYTVAVTRAEAPISTPTGTPAVGNIGQTAAAAGISLKTYEVAHGFRTGPDGSDYVIESVVVKFKTGGAAGGVTYEWRDRGGDTLVTATRPDPVKIFVQEWNSRELGRGIGPFERKVATAGDNTFRFLGTERLARNQDYVVLITTDNTTDNVGNDPGETPGETPAELAQTASNNEDAGGRDGWDLDADYFSKLHSQWPNEPWSTNSNGAMIQVNVNAAPPDPGEGLRVHDTSVHESDLTVTVQLQDRTEQYAALNFKVTLDPPPPSGERVSVPYRTVDSSSGHCDGRHFVNGRCITTARAPEDYIPTQGKLIFNSGEDSKTVQVQVVDDVIEDSGEALELVLGPGRVESSTGSWLNNRRPPVARSRGLGTIYNSEEAASLSTVLVADATVAEGDSATLDFVVSLSAATTGTVSFDYATEDGTATDGEDYTGRSGRISLVAGETTATISVPVTDDSDAEGDETLTLTLSNVRHANFANEADTLRATGTIEDDEGHDRPHDLQATVAEGAVVLTWQDPTTYDPNDLYHILRHRPELGEAEPRTYVEYGHITDRTFTDTAVVAGVLYGYAVQAVKDVLGNMGPMSGTVEVRVPADSMPPLTATFSGMPDSHDGSTEFDFTLTFSEDIEDLSYVTLRDSAFVVTYGDVLKARRQEQGKNRKWTITVEPEGNADVTIELPATTDCAASGAICTSDNRKLSNSESDTVEGPVSLTASFSGMPDSHTGAEFDFTLTFSEEPRPDFSYRTLRDTAFVVTAGDVRRARRQEQGKNRKWTITVEPDSATVTVIITLPETTSCTASGAICTEDGRKLSGAVSDTVVAASSSAGDAQGDAALDDALEVLDGVTPDRAAAALLGEGRLSEAQLDALDRLGNRNGDFDLGDVLSWRDRCGRGEARCGSMPKSPSGASLGLLFGAAAAGRGRTSRRTRWRTSGRRRARGTVLAALLAAVTAWSCTGDLAGPPAANRDDPRARAVELPAPTAIPRGPGFLAVEWTAPAAGRAIGVLLELEGPGITAVEAAAGLELYRSGAQEGRHRIVVAGPLEDGPLLSFRVPDRGRVDLYRVRVLEVTGQDYALEDPEEYRAVAAPNGRLR
ncbi:MAG: hypothetical protein F4037_01600 [Gemmatimonadales bacterium]|nr:hypothetical protein [Gemmatimonadales bacterium]MYK00645.1 hypothetical protein [Candidatus Palauibacter ramosifaciens]